jgi:prepilin-type N-terminal cleavage/methylation domain-containing protein
MKISNKGFTLIELILYVTIVTIMLSALVPFAWNIVGGSAKSSAQQEVSSQARLVSERIKYEIRNANSINSPAASASATILNINSPTATIIDLTAGKVRISTNGGTSYDNLNSADTVVSNLTFTSYTSGDNKTKHIQFIFTIDDNFNSQRQEYNVPAYTLRGSAELRSN